MKFETYAHTFLAAYGYTWEDVPVELQTCQRGWHNLLRQYSPMDCKLIYLKYLPAMPTYRDCNVQLIAEIIQDHSRCMIPVEETRSALIKPMLALKRVRQTQSPPRHGNSLSQGIPETAKNFIKLKILQMTACLCRCLWYSGPTGKRKP